MTWELPKTTWTPNTGTAIRRAPYSCAGTNLGSQDFGTYHGLLPEEEEKSFRVAVPLLGLRPNRLAKGASGTFELPHKKDRKDQMTLRNVYDGPSTIGITVGLATIGVAGMRCTLQFASPLIPSSYQPTQKVQLKCQPGARAKKNTHGIVFGFVQTRFHNGNPTGPSELVAIPRISGLRKDNPDLQNTKYPRQWPSSKSPWCIGHYVGYSGGSGTPPRAQGLSSQQESGTWRRPAIAKILFSTAWSTKV